MRRSLAFTSALLACSMISLAVARTSVSQATPKYVGSETCKGCHEGQWTAFQKNAHYRAEQDPGLVSDQAGCESCHGPGSLHAEAGGDRSNPDFATIRNFKTMPADKASEVCASCHSGGQQFYWKHSDHARGGVSCLQCHSVHHAKSEGAGPMLTTASVNQLCVTCHKDKRAAVARSGHMPLREGSMNCADCHNPHGSATPHQIRAASNNDLCYTCHADKRGPFLWEHAPVRENCLNCHNPHGTSNDKALAAKRPYLCQSCHVGTRHPSTLYDKPDLLGNRLFNRSCTNCHSQVHGSNHPSGKYLER